MENLKVNIKEVLVFLLGFFSTFELVQLFGVTMFSCILIGFSIYMVVSEKKLYIKNIYVYIWIYIAIVTISELLSFTIQLDNKIIWIISSIKKYILLFFLIIALTYILKMKNGRKQFFRGLYCSCFVEMIWCYLQFVCYKFASVDINMSLFGVSHISNFNGQLVLSGLNSNAGILAPILFFLILFDKRTVIKLLSVVLFFISGTSTMVICGVVILFTMLVHHIYTKIIQDKPTIKQKTIRVFGILLFIMFILVTVKPEMLQNLSSSFSRLFNRLSDARTANFTDGSTFTHTRYYTSILYVLSNSNPINIMFGNGIDCAGVPFVRLFNQYSDIIYVPESDPITFLYNYGIIGFLFIYSMIIFVIGKGRKIDWKYASFFFSVLIGGLFYGMFLNWVLLVTWLSIGSIHEKKSIFEEYSVNKRKEKAIV